MDAEKAKHRLSKWWEGRVDATLLRRVIGSRMPVYLTDPYTDPTLAHLDPEARPGMAALREGAETMGKR